MHPPVPVSTNCKAAWEHVLVPRGTHPTSGRNCHRPPRETPKGVSFHHCILGKTSPKNPTFPPSAMGEGQRGSGCPMVGDGRMRMGSVDGLMCTQLGSKGRAPDQEESSGPEIQLVKKQLEPSDWNLISRARGRLAHWEGSEGNATGHEPGRCGAGSCVPEQTLPPWNWSPTKPSSSLQPPRTRYPALLRLRDLWEAGKGRSFQSCRQLHVGKLVRHR